MLGQYEEAVLAFFECLALEGNTAGGKPLKAEICKVLNRLAVPDTEAEEKTAPVEGLISFGGGGGAGEEGGNKILIPKNQKVCR